MGGFGDGEGEVVDVGEREVVDGGGGGGEEEENKEEDNERN